VRSEITDKNEKRINSFVIHNMQIVRRK